MWNGFERNLRRIPQTRQAKYPLKCFHDDLVRISPYLSIDAGIRGIDVERITGSVNKYNVLDQHFRNVNFWQNLKNCLFESSNQNRKRLHQ